MKSRLTHSGNGSHLLLAATDFFKSCKYLSLWNLYKDSHLTPKKQVVTCFLGKGNKVLVLQRGRKDLQYELWGIPGGKLAASEPIIKGLQREILEETGIRLQESSFIYLNSAISKTTTDGKYGLHLYYAEFPNDKDPVINPNEHLSFQWVSLDEFINLNLLHAQKEAFLLVQLVLQAYLNNKVEEYAFK